jgi:dGTPase
MASEVKAVEMLVKVLCPHDAKCGMAVSHLEKLKILLVFRSLIRTFARMMMEWQRLISNKRLGQEHRHVERHDDRTEFKRDYDRLIFSAPFRRLQNKTQVFPLPGSVFVHNRLTHSLEVASVGMSLGNDVSARIIKDKRPELKGTLFEEIGQIVATACLAHDLGNPPFGHSGEKAIQTFFTEGNGRPLQEMVSPEFWGDITHFEGNANAFRLLTHQFKGRRPGGFVMTYSTIASIVKYPFSSLAPSKKGKFGFFVSEQETFQRLTDEMGIICKSEPGSPLRYARHPLVYLVEAADDICYEIMDLEDAHKLKILTFETVSRLFLDFFDETAQEHILKRIKDEQLTDKNEQIVYLRACVIGKLENECVNTFIAHEEEILAGEFEGGLIDHINPLQRDAYKRCALLSVDKIYRSRPVLDVELSGYQIMATLMEKMTEAVMNPQRYYSQQLIGRVSSQYDIDAEDLESRLMAVIDYISGMTDVYALDVYQKINGISLPIV